MGQLRRRLTDIELAMGCNAGPTLNQSLVGRPTSYQAWGQCTRYFGTLVLDYRLCSTRRYSVLILLKSTCTRTCTQVLLKMKVFLTSTYEYFTSTSHLKLIQNTSHTNHKSV